MHGWRAEVARVRDAVAGVFDDLLAALPAEPGPGREGRVAWLLEQARDAAVSQSWPGRSPPGRQPRMLLVGARLLRQHVVEQGRPAGQSVTGLADAWLDGEADGPRLADGSADLGGQAADIVAEGAAH
jgi:hypothetical protein